MASCGAQPGARGEPRALGVCPGGHLLTAVGAHAGHEDPAAGRGDRHARVVDRENLSGLTGGAALELLGVEELHGRAAERGPGAGLGIGPANEVPRGLQRLLPVDLHVLLLAPALVRSLRLVLDDLRRLARAHEIDALEQRRHAHREEPVELKAAGRVGVADLDFFLQQDRSGIEPLVGPEEGEPGARVALDDRPVDRARPSMEREQRGMVLDRAARRTVQHFVGHDERDVGHHAQVRLESPEFLPHLGLVTERLRLMDRQTAREGRFLQRIDPPALRRIGGAVDADDVFPAPEERFQHALAECLLPVDDDAHDVLSRGPRSALDHGGIDVYTMEGSMSKRAPTVCAASRYMATAAHDTAARGRLDLALSRLPDRVALSGPLHRLAERGDGAVGLARQELRPVTQLMALLDQPARGVADPLRLLAYFARERGAAVEMMANTLGQVGPASSAHVRARVQKTRGHLMPLNQALAARRALRHGVAPAVPEEQQTFLAAQMTGSLAVEMYDPTAADVDGIVGRDHLRAARALRLWLRQRRGRRSP